MGSLHSGWREHPAAGVNLSLLGQGCALAASSSSSTMLPMYVLKEGAATGGFVHFPVAQHVSAAAELNRRDSYTTEYLNIHHC
jgi:hypothetical protein